VGARCVAPQRWHCVQCQGVPDVDQGIFNKWRALSVCGPAMPHTVRCFAVDAVVWDAALLQRSASHQFPARGTAHGEGNPAVILSANGDEVNVGVGRLQPPKTLAVAAETTKSPGGFGLEAELGREAVKGDAAAITAVTPTKGSFGLDAEVDVHKMPLKVQTPRPAPPPLHHPQAMAPQMQYAHYSILPDLRHVWSHQICACW
jgi:hypothetical protein